MTKRVMFDSNAFDDVAKDITLLKAASEKGQIEYYVTSIQIEEIANIPDEKKETRLCVFRNFAELRPRIVPVPFSFSCIDFSCFSFDTGPSLPFFPSSYEKDMLIAKAAIYENCIFVTNDARVVKKLNKNGYLALYYPEFIKQLTTVI